MKLTVEERLTMLGMLPKEGNFLELRIIRELREALSFTEQEHAALRFSEQKGVDGKALLVWTVEHVDASVLYADIPIGPKATSVVVAALEKLDKEKKLTEQHFSLYEKFCATENKET